MEAGADHAMGEVALHLYQGFVGQGAIRGAASSPTQQSTIAPEGSRG